MKAIITGLLIAGLLWPSACKAAEICRELPKDKDGLTEAVLVLGCLGVATCFIVRVMAHNDQVRIHRLVLQKSPTLDGKNWVSVTTNDFNLTPEQFFPAFAARMGGNAQYYRVIEIPIPPGGNIALMTKTVYVE